ncbi:DUF742 domain-containing protein [Pseudonocardia saturnea]
MVSSADGPPPEIGLTGARFGGPSRRRRTRAERAAESAVRESAGRVVDEPAADPSAAGPVGLTGARFGGPARARREAAKRAEPPVADPVSPPPPAPVPRSAPVGEPPRPAAPPPPEPSGPEPSPHGLVRPYVLTGGRTRAGVEFAIEALITSTRRPGPVGEPMEHARIRGLCGQPRSVAEVAALLGVPLGVARVLLADMLAAGSVQVHRTVDAGGPDLALLERVLSGLRRL